MLLLLLFLVRLISFFSSSGTAALFSPVVVPPAVVLVDVPLFLRCRLLLLRFDLAGSEVDIIEVEGVEDDDDVRSIRVEFVVDGSCSLLLSSMVVCRLSITLPLLAETGGK